MTKSFSYREISPEGYVFSRIKYAFWSFPIRICPLWDIFTLKFSSVQLLRCVWLFVSPWTAAHLASLSITHGLQHTQASLSITISQSLLKFMSIESVMPSSHIILCCPLSSCLQSFPASGLLQRVSYSHQVAKVLEFQLQHQSFQWIFRTDFL